MEQLGTMAECHQKIELLAPAGNFEKLEIAIHYGADAVYLSGENFSLRNFSGNFSIDELYKGVQIARQNNVKVYLACNAYPRNFEESAITEYLYQIGEINPDAIIIADPGIFMEARRVIGHIPVHLSTQANTTSRQSVRFWESMGVKRINAARELSLHEIREIVDSTSVEVEAFIHGAMCIAYSGRCLLSSFMAHRDSNRGMCTHPCRWTYFLMEETRPGQYMPVYEDQRGTYIFNSRDLCMISHIPEMINAGISSLKIEGRLKGLNYVAAVVKTYREAIDAYYKSPEAYTVLPQWEKELAGINQRGYCTGFYFNNLQQAVPDYSNAGPSQPSKLAGKITDVIDENWIRLNVRNKLHNGDLIEILSAKQTAKLNRISDMISDQGERISIASPETSAIIGLESDMACEPNDIVRLSRPLPADET